MSKRSRSVGSLRDRALGSAAGWVVLLLLTAGCGQKGALVAVKHPGEAASSASTRTAVSPPSPLAPPEPLEPPVPGTAPR